MSEKKINVFILTGFLGAGKTTILNQLLGQFEGENNVVIENEFGKVNIDVSVVQARFESIYEITNGCICCTLDDELHDVLGEIARQKEKVDNIFIETTGIADVGNLNSLFKVVHVAEVFQLRKIVCVADCQSLEDVMDQAIEPQRQLVASDLIVLNKSQLVSPTYLSELKQKVASINPYAKVVECPAGLLSKALLFEQSSEEKLVQEVVINHNNSHRINNVLFESNDVFEYDALYHVLHITLLLYYSQVFRIKGFVRCINTSKGELTPGIFEVQSTGKALTISPFQKEDFEKNQVVFIGRELKTDTVRRILRGAIAKDKHTNNKEFDHENTKSIHQ